MVFFDNDRFLSVGRRRRDTSCSRLVVVVAKAKAEKLVAFATLQSLERYLIRIQCGTTLLLVGRKDCDSLQATLQVVW